MKKFEISGEEFELLTDALYGVGVGCIDQATVIKALVDYLANISVHDVISSDMPEAGRERIRRICN